MKVLIDADIIAYRVGFASEHTYYDLYDDADVVDGVVVANPQPVHESFDNAKDCNLWMKENDSNDMTRVARVEHDPVENCLHSVKVVMERLFDRYGRDHVCYFSCGTPDNWRTEMYPEYKANRAPRKPHWVREIREYMERKYTCITPEGLEADDLIAMNARTLDEKGEPFVVVTIDKDMLQIPGLHYNWVKDYERMVTQDEANQMLTVQRLMGDSTDNIKGIPGWGEVSAKQWLAGYVTDETVDEMVSEGYGCAKDKKGNFLWDAREARYQSDLNTALVTLPTSYAHLAEMQEVVQNAWNAFQTYQKDDKPNSGSDAASGQQ